MNRRERPPNLADVIAILIGIATIPFLWRTYEHAIEQGRFWEMYARVGVGAAIVVFIVLRRAIRRRG